MPGANNEIDDNGKNNGKNAQGAGAGTGDEGTEDQNLNAGAGTGEDNGADDDFKDPVKALAEIKKLRQENAKHRTKNKSLEEQMSQVTGTIQKMKTALGLESEEEDPEQVASTLKYQNQAFQMEIALSELCSEHDIPRKGEKYFKFLLQQEFQSLGDDEEVSEDRIAEMVSECKKMFGGAAPSSTGVNSGKAPKDDAGAGSMSAAQFAKMNPGEKSALYVKDPSLYTKLFNEAKEKRLF